MVSYNNLENLKSIIQINGQNAVDISFAHYDSFEDGQTVASVLSGRLKDGLDQDVIAGIKLDTISILSPSMQYRLYNEALRYAGANIRQLELYKTLQGFTLKTTALLQGKCGEELPIH